MQDTLKAEIWSSIFLFLFFFFPQITSTTAIISTGGDSVNYSTTWCSDIEIRFPFRLKDRQPENCGYPGFELSCTNNNETVLDIPFSGRFFVSYIDYTNQGIETYDPADCLLGRLLDLNLSDSPYKLSESRNYMNYTFFNCSNQFEDSYYEPRNCLSPSSSTYKVIGFPPDYTAEMVSLGANCTLLVTIPWKFIYYDRWKSYERKYLPLSWDKPDCLKCEAERRYCGFKNYNTSSDLAIRCLGIHATPWKFIYSQGALGENRTIRKKIKNISIGELGENTNIRKKIKNISIGVSVGLFVFLVATLTFIKTRKQTNAEEIENQLKIETFLENYNALKPTRYSYADIKKITNKFKSKLGQGGYGSVFKGKLANGIPVAVKILNNSKGNGEEFINEVGTIGRIHHVNVVRLLGFCADGIQRALIYEFMPNMSLDRFIFSRKDRKQYLGWEKLQNIAISIARGIQYLHQGCDQRILHFDIKPQNILLDHNFNPKISDFGLAKLCSKEDSIVSMASARGTMGYIAPEVFSRNFGSVSCKSDIYSFGMLLLEMVGGRRNIEVMAENPSQVYFPEWIYHRVDKGEDLGIQADTEEDATIAKKLIVVGLWCVQWHPVDRPLMKSVVQMLELNFENLIMPPNPFASIARGTTSTTILGITPQAELTVILEESN